MPDSPSVIEIHTGDRGMYKRCRRKWGWGSTLRDNYVATGPENKNFWLGTGFHFALEDYWGYRRFDHPALAFAAYYDATKPDDRPDEADELLELATGMLRYYVDEWLLQHPEDFQTLVIDGKPQVEVEVAVDLTSLLYQALPAHHPAFKTFGIGPEDYQSWLEEEWGGREVHYIMTFDRVVIDTHERMWGLDYKTAASFDQFNLQTNPQAGSYDWGLDLFYSPHGYKDGGMIWQQHRKVVPQPPRVVNPGKKNEGVSKDYGQSTTYKMYRRALREYYGAKNPWPEDYNGILGSLAAASSFEGDAYIRRDLLRRNPQQRLNEQAKIVAEVLEMLDPNLPLYPNPTFECKGCPFRSPCLQMDDGSNYEHTLTTEYIQVSGYKDDWRKRVKYPSAIPA